MSLLDELKTVRDRRTSPRYPQWIVLMLVIMGTMSGRYGYRPLSRFVHRHQAALIEAMELPYERLPSLTTLRNVLIHLDYQELAEAFNRWAVETSLEPSSELPQQLATDGKAIKASLSDYSESYQNFASLVSMFNVNNGQVVALAPMHNKKDSEITVVRELLEQLQLTGVCVSLDALHTKKNGPVNRFTGK